MIDKKYNELLTKILTEGKLRDDRTGTGTISIFNAQIEHNMSDGFPLLTGKKMYVHGIIHELLWFLNGDTNIQYLVENGVNIWTPDAYREYKKGYKKSYDQLSDNPVIDVQPYEEPSMDEFKDKIINDDKFAKEHGELGPIYGKQWVNWNTDGFNKDGTLRENGGYGINQIQQVIDKLNNKPEDRRIMVSAWNVSDIDKMALPPCHYGFELYTEELTHNERVELWAKQTGAGFWASEMPMDIMLCETLANDPSEEFMTEEGVPTRKLSLKWHQRSVDFGLGLPFNIASYGLLLEMFAQQANMVPRKLIGDLTNVHIYKNHINIIKEQLAREPYQLPVLHLNKAKDIFSYNYSDFTIKNYKSHPTLRMDISV